METVEIVHTPLLREQPGGKTGEDAPEPEFRFKYFQQLEGYLSLPEGFSPTQLRLTLEAGNRRATVQRSYARQELLDGGTHPATPADH